MPSPPSTMPAPPQPQHFYRDIDQFHQQRPQHPQVPMPTTIYPETIDPRTGLNLYMMN